MTPERFQQIEKLYLAARERTAEERAALLAQTDPELRREVESLLAQRPGVEFLNRPAIQNTPELPDDLTVTALTSGARLGPYQLESKLGEGGMGEVFRAVDTRLGRPVAIKFAHEQFSARFEREARAISSLNHPNICTLHDVGPNYLVMDSWRATPSRPSSRAGSSGVVFGTRISRGALALASGAEMHECATGFGTITRRYFLCALLTQSANGV